MTQKNFMFKTIGFAFLFATALQFTACGDNPIEVENEKQHGFSQSKIDKALADLNKQRANVDFYRCMQENKQITDKAKRKLRCENFLEKYSDNTDLSIIVTMVSDTVNYGDKGEFLRAKEASANPHKPGSTDPDSPESVHYLAVNKMLNLTLTKYEQVADSISDSEEVGDPDIRFIVKTFIEEDSSGYEPITALVLDTLNVKKWKGKKATAVLIPRGIDALEICPIVIDKNELEDHFENETVLNKCIKVKDIGFIENKKTTEVKTDNKKVELQWEWFLYEAK